MSMVNISLNELARIKVYGPESTDWLNRILSNKILEQHTKPIGAAYLDYRARPSAFFWLYTKSPQNYELLCFKEDLQESFKLLEGALFGEDLQIEVNPKQDSLCLQIDFANLDSSYTTELFEEICSIQENCDNLLSLQEFKNALEFFGFLGLEQMKDKILIESAVYNTYIHHDKGCYPGQEVINKIISMGKPPKFLLRLDSDDLQLSIKLEIPDLNLQEDFNFKSFNGISFGNVFVRNKFLEDLKSKDTIALKANGTECQMKTKVWELQC